MRGWRGCATRRARAHEVGGGLANHPRHDVRESGSTSPDQLASMTYVRGGLVAARAVYISCLSLRCFESRERRTNSAMPTPRESSLSACCSTHSRLPRAVMVSVMHRAVPVLTAASSPEVVSFTHSITNASSRSQVVAGILRPYGCIHLCRLGGPSNDELLRALRRFLPPQRIAIRVMACTNRHRINGR